MENPFDKFDAPKQANPFDRFDEPEAKPNPFSLNQERVDAVKQGARNVMGGLAQSGMGIASNLMRPFEALIPGGEDFDSGNQKRMERVKGRFERQGYDPESMAFKGGELGGQVALTAPVGGILAKGAEAVPLIARTVPALPTALRTGGMRAGTTPGVANMATRVAGGAITGGTSAALIDPEYAGTGAMVGGALPPAMMAAGKVGQAIGRTVSGPPVAEPVRKAVEGARASGYVIPPSQAKPTLVNRALEGFSGKITTAQNASARNQGVTNRLVAKELGLPDGTPVTLDTLKAIRTNAGQAYEAVGSSGVINTTPDYIAALDNITEPARKAAAGFPNAKPSPIISEIEALKTTQMDAASAVAKVKELRNAADAAYRSGDKDLGKALKAGSAAIEDAIESHLQAIGAPADMLSGFRDARKLIAKTYSVEKAMNPTTGNVDAVKLAGQLTKGKPLSGGIRSAAEFAQQFPKAAQTVERMGSLPQVSPLDFGALGTVSALTSNPLLMAGVVARPAARAAVLSPMVQNGLSRAPTHPLQGLLSNPELQQLLYRSAPVVSAR